MPEPIPETPALRLRLPIQDLLALVLGYGMAALFFRAFWPIEGLRPGLVTPAVAFYAWLGLAMSSPALLSHARPMKFDAADLTARSNFRPARTGSEMAWLWIGIYWIILALFVIPSRLSQFGLRDTLLLVLLPSLAVVAARCLRPKQRIAADSERPWTKPVAVAVVVTWPLAWVCLIILGQTVL